MSLLSSRARLLIIVIFIVVFLVSVQNVLAMRRMPRDFDCEQPITYYTTRTIMASWKDRLPSGPSPRGAVLK
ncbi:hypothetical protein IEQ34_001260 [Dendrobium chrysotoxum]|uniref:Transmembrane protein n=1 Tax=Dendrobium chrysotoxum TaxID=161865 RepID=A0AAV7HMT9_DENCH|nr:hypothetical protein IEQ34_001260 [Dendrobium chrysotoxum]